jgi:hypothetical protein
MRVTTFKCNGIRATARKGFFAWLRRTSPEIVCLQETKAQEHQLPPEALDLDECAGDDRLRFPAFRLARAEQPPELGSEALGRELCLGRQARELRFV